MLVEDGDAPGTRNKPVQQPDCQGVSPYKVCQPLEGAILMAMKPRESHGLAWRQDAGWRNIRWETNESFRKVGNPWVLNQREAPFVNRGPTLRARGYDFHLGILFLLFWF